jgi:predicted HTH domain antitoxin
VDELLTVRVPTEIQRMLNRTPEEMERDIRLYAALMLYQQRKLSSGAAAAMAGIPRVMFLDLCADYHIPVSQISAEDLRREMSDEQTPDRL